MLDSCVTSTALRSYTKPSLYFEVTWSFFQVITFKKAILKFDIDGKEFDGLHNASRLFNEIDIPAVFMEWGVIKRDYPKYGGRKIPDFIVDFFSRRKYRPYKSINLSTLLGPNYFKWPWDIVWIKDGKFLDQPD